MRSLAAGSGPRRRCVERREDDESACGHDAPGRWRGHIERARVGAQVVQNDDIKPRPLEHQTREARRGDRWRYREGDQGRLALAAKRREARECRGRLAARCAAGCRCSGRFGACSAAAGQLARWGLSLSAASLGDGHVAARRGERESFAEICLDPRNTRAARGASGRDAVRRSDPLRIRVLRVRRGHDAAAERPVEALDRGVAAAVCPALARGRASAAAARAGKLLARAEIKPFCDLFRTRQHPGRGDPKRHRQTDGEHHRNPS